MNEQPVQDNPDVEPENGTSPPASNPDVQPDPSAEETVTDRTSPSAKEKAKEILVHELNLGFAHAEKIIQQLERRGILLVHEVTKSGVGGL